MGSATKFVDFFVHDILDYTILNKDCKNFTKNITLFNVRHAVDEIIESLEDKIKLKKIFVEARYYGFQDENCPLVKTDILDPITFLLLNEIAQN